MRNPNPFTNRQIKLLEAIRERIRQINDPDPEIITHESYEFHTEQTKQFGKIPKIRFRPHSSQIKAELIREAGLIDKSREEKTAQIRQKYGIREARNKEARLFESEWNNIMLKAKKATITVALINQLFANRDQALSDPVWLMQSIVMDEYASQIKAKKKPIHPFETPQKTAEAQEKKGIKPYNEELGEVE